MALFLRFVTLYCLLNANAVEDSFGIAGNCVLYFLYN